MTGPHHAPLIPAARRFALVLLLAAALTWPAPGSRPDALAAPAVEQEPQIQEGWPDPRVLRRVRPPILPREFHVAVEAPHADPNLEALVLSKAYRAALTPLLDRLAAEARDDARFGPTVRAFTDPELTAALSVLVTPQARLDSRVTEDEAYYRLTLRAVLDPERLVQRLEHLAGDAALRADLARAYEAEQVRQRELDARDPPVAVSLEDNEVTMARLRLQGDAADPGPATRAGSVGRDIVLKTAFAGMSAAGLMNAAGWPDENRISTAAGRYDCLRFGDIWAVFREGQLSCLRTRLQYDVRHQSDCSCFGEASTFAPFAPQTKHADP